MARSEFPIELQNRKDDDADDDASFCLRQAKAGSNIDGNSFWRIVLSPPRSPTLAALPLPHRILEKVSHGEQEKR